MILKIPVKSIHKLRY